MYLKYGAYQFDDNSCLVTTSLRVRWNAGGQAISTIQRMDVRGFLSLASYSDTPAVNQAALTVKASALATALAVQFQDLALYTDAGARSATYLLNQGSITGVRIVEGPTFPEANGPEYATIRTFSFAAEAEYPFTAALSGLLSFQETLSFGGGQPLYVMRRAINGPPQRQLIYPATEFTCVQSGSASGYRAYPTPPAAKFPFALKESPNVTQTSPTRKSTGQYEGFGVSWRYVFESVTPLSANPTLWVK